MHPDPSADVTFWTENRLPNDVLTSGIEGARLRCGNYLGEPRWRTCGVVLGSVEGLQHGLRIVPGYLEPSPNRGNGGVHRRYLTGRLDQMTTADWWDQTGYGHVLERWVIRCVCGKDQVLRLDRIVPAFVEAVRAGARARPVRVNPTKGWPVHPNGARLACIDLFIGKANPRRVTPSR